EREWGGGGGTGEVGEPYGQVPLADRRRRLARQLQLVPTRSCVDGERLLARREAEVREPPAAPAQRELLVVGGGLPGHRLQEPEVEPVIVLERQRQRAHRDLLIPARTPRHQKEHPVDALPARGRPPAPILAPPPMHPRHFRAP